MVPSPPFLCCASRIFYSMVPSPSCLCCGFLCVLSQICFFSPLLLPPLSLIETANKKSSDSCLFQNLGWCCKQRKLKKNLSITCHIMYPFTQICISRLWVSFQWWWWWCVRSALTESDPSDSFHIPLTKLTIALKATPIAYMSSNSANVKM